MARRIMTDLTLLADFFYAQLPDASAYRRTALDSFLKKGFPGAPMETWKYTRTRAMADQLLPLAPIPSPTVPDVLSNLLIDRSAYSVVCIDGVFMPDFSQLPEQAGVRIYTKILDAAEQSDGFVALNQALARECLVVEVAEQVKVDCPIYLMYLTTASNAAHYPQTHIVLKESAELTCIQQRVSTVEGKAWIIDHTTIHLANQSICHLFQVSDYKDQQYYVQYTDVQQECSSQFNAYTYPLEQSWSYNALTIVLKGVHAQCVLKGAYVLSNTQHVDQCIRIEHVAPETKTQLDYHGVVDHCARGIFNAKVVVHPHAQHVVATQNNANILLSDRAEVDTHPEFEIYADDVKCHHGATVGALDEDALFYLETRGISADVARGMLLYGFIYTCFPKNFPSVETLLTQWLQRRLELHDDVI